MATRHPESEAFAESFTEMRPGKWTTEGKGNSRKAQYPRRRPALPAENVLAFSFEWVPFGAN